MATKTLSITTEVYEKLKRRKLPGESFSDTIGRLADRGRLSDCAGLWEDMKDNEYEKMVEAIEGVRKGATRNLFKGLE